ncbi:unnamed protein product [Rotaria socialis]|uniref:Uncharacterized protein n=1 Tax=Rotaria socialis TaxID=392032 RepID=A0A821RIL7_9BILA|nr:unnamed protein product [Rotaria socialis]CAF3385977.1 unnamed protein product [Rotaria socialis]CAF3388556.1 unnamed protein product [Rotaria socialis]CAF4455102.1 unnamed protein product [Rotaria socialis]CAF4534063.1 unnamed protein product [Rotaria socialis]
MASNSETATLENQTNQSTTGNERVQQLILKFKGKAEWYMRLQRLDDDNVKAIAKELKGDENCEELYLNNNHITTVGIEYLAELLKGNRKLKILELENNPIGDEGIQCLCEVLTCPHILKSLNLSNTGMTYKSGAAVAKMIESTKTLEQLDLRQEESFLPFTVRRITEANKNRKIENLFYSKLSDEEGYRKQE